MSRQNPSALLPETDHLAAVENWLQEFIVDPEDHDAVQEREAANAQRLIKPSSTLTSLERAQIYRGMYMLRMEECLGADYPAIKHFLGEHEFWHFVERYVQAHPSRSYNISRLSDSVPTWLATATGFKRPGFLYDLATLEHTICTVFEAPASPVLTQEDVAIVPQAAWATARVRPVAALRLLSLSYPVNDYLVAVHTKKPPSSTRRQPNWIAVWRQKNYNMWRLPLNAAEFNLLSDIVGGRQLGEALVRAMAGRNRLDGQGVFRCFSRWVAEGFFSAIEWQQPADTAS